MNNILYDNFLAKYISQEIDLLLEETYKIALFTDRYTPSADDAYTYDSLYLAGYECEDGNDVYSDDTDKAYKKGGRYITFTQLTSKSASKANYSCGKVTWHNVTLESGNEAKYAIIYREEDGLLMACFPFENAISISDDTLILDWNKITTISLDLSSTITIDGELSKTSTNAVQNKVLTDALEKVGVAINGETPPDPLTDIDKMDKITSSQIDELFN